MNLKHMIKIAALKKTIAKPFPFLRIPRRVFHATLYYNKRYLQIIKWGFNSNEGGNYTYDLTKSNMLYLAHIVSLASGVRLEQIQCYIDEACNDKMLKDHIILETKRSSLSTYADLRVSFGRRLGWYAFTRALRPQVIVETGIDKGMGSVLLCSALLRNKGEGFEGRYYGTDINPDAGYLLSSPYSEVGEVLYGDSIESLRKFKQNIDLFINDSDHSPEYEKEEYLTIEKKLAPNAYILGDNSHVSNELADFSTETGRSFLFFKEEPRNHWYPGAGIGISFRKEIVKK